MYDVQGRSDTREIDLQQAGVKNVHLPFQVQQKDGGVQTVLARARLSVALPRQLKGTHMSRLIEVLERWKDQPLPSGHVEPILVETRQRLEAARAQLGLAFTYFRPKRAPVSGQVGTVGYPCAIEASLADTDGYEVTLGVQVSITTVCPCSKEISNAGAHNQRARLSAQVRPLPGATIWLDDLIAGLETFGSCEVYPLVKRPDEKYLTEQGYATPKFVEDVVRDAVLWLRHGWPISWFAVECDADESIHPHNAFASQSEHVLAALAPSWPESTAAGVALSAAGVSRNGFGRH